MSQRSYGINIDVTNPDKPIYRLYAVGYYSEQSQTALGYYQDRDQAYRQLDNMTGNQSLNERKRI